MGAHYGIDDGSATWAMGDFTGDGNVNVGDLGILGSTYGQDVFPPPSGGAGPQAQPRIAQADVRPLVARTWTRNLLS